MSRIDRREKLLAYREIAALEEYVLVDQELPRLTLLRRSDAWRPVPLGQHDTLALASIGLELPVTDLYDGVDLQSRPDGD